MRISVCRIPLLLAISWLAVVGLLRVPEARATVGPPVLVTLDGPAGPAVRGQPWSGTLRIVSSEAGLVHDFHVHGSSWGLIDWGSQQEFPLQAGVPIDLPFSGTPLEGPFPLVASFRFGAMEGHVTLDLSAEAWAIGQGPAPAVKIPGGAVSPPPAGASVMLSPPLPETVLAADIGRLDQSDGDPGKGPRPIRVRGRFAYQNRDGVFVGADGVTVRVYHQQSVIDALLVATVTDPWGRFDVTFNWTGSDDPDLYLNFGLFSGRVQVKSASWIDLLTAGPHQWRTGTVMDYPGNDLDFGDQGPGDAPAARQAVHLFTNLTRAWRWLAVRGYDAPAVTARFPSEWWPQYAANLPFIGDTIFMRGGPDNVTFGWNDGTHVHEYGHHFVNRLATPVSPDYGNGICDTPNAGHCMWCQETDHDAFSEGFPNWLADIVTRSLATDYGTPTLTARPQEMLGNCIDSSGNPCPCDPLLTEGFLGAVLRDIEDATQDAHGAFAGGNDELALGEDEILHVVTVDRPTTPVEFLQDFSSRYPQVREQLWATAKNSGYELDTLPPGVVSNLASSTHTPGGLASPAPRIALEWTPAADEMSGIAGYSILVLPFPATIGPDNVAEIGRETSYTTGTLTAGNWWFSIRAIDRSGKASESFAQIGPLGISNPVPNDLRHEVPFGWNWSGPIAVRSTPDATAGSALNSATLPGDAEFYVNNLIYNFGAPTVNFSYSLLSLDGEYPFFGASWLVPSLPGYTPSAKLNVPFSATGGRHTVAIQIDSSDFIAETDEVNNLFGQQFVWIPATIAVGTPVARLSPPLRDGGGGAVPGGLLWDNCDGVRFAAAPATGHWWNVAWLHAADNAIDFDLGLHPPATSVNGGFQNPVAWSAWGAGYLDFVVLDNHQVPAGNWDLGVVNYSGVYRNYRLGVEGSAPLNLGDAPAADLAQDEMLRVWDVAVPGGVPVSVVADLHDPSQGQIHLAWFGAATTTAARSGAAATAVSDAGGRARLDLGVLPAGSYGLVLFREPNRGNQKQVAGAPAKALNPPLDIVLSVTPTPADYRPFLAGGWAAPLVPRPTADGVFYNVPAPTTLIGGAATYLNLAAINSGNGPGAVIPAGVRVDGQPQANLLMTVGSGLGYATLNSSPQVTVGGGRHTLSMKLDPLDAESEMYETNNVYGEPWIWSPPTVAAQSPVVRPAPPALDGGWTEITTLAPFHPNCDGLRTPTPGEAGWTGSFVAVAVVPGPASDVDLNLHEVSTGPKSGFADPLASSAWSAGCSDYVLANFQATASRTLDAGIVRWMGSESCTIEAVGSTLLPPGGEHGPFAVAGGHILRIHELDLAAGLYRIELENVSGIVDWGLTLHDAQAPYGGKLPLQVERIADAAGSGGGEILMVGIERSGRYGLAVWKSGATDLAQAGEYRLVVTAGASTTPTAVTPGVQAALRSARPNPFNPRTTIAFELGRDGRASLVVYNLRGERVRGLLSADFAAGTVEAVWDGTDDAGRRVAGGIYTVRLEALGVVDERKISLVK